MNLAQGRLWGIAWGCVACGSREPDVLILTLDTTRADAIGAFGRTPSPTPNIDRLAAKGIKFEQAITPVPLTLPAHVSLFSGAYPSRHGVHDNLSQLVAADVPLLAARLSEAGYATGAFVASVVLDSTYGLDRGFQSYQDNFDLTRLGIDGDSHGRWSAEDVLERATRWISAQSSDRPMLAWVHFYDAHAPCSAPGRFSRFGDYVGSIAYIDEQIGLLLGEVERVRGDRPLWVVVAADHGEGRGEHGETNHGLLLYRSTTRVPLILAGSAFQSGQTVSEPVSLIDVAPTLLEALGLPRIGEGRSLLGPLESMPVFSETWTPGAHFGLSDLYAVSDGPWHTVIGTRTESFQVVRDPLEQRNLWGQFPKQEHQHVEAIEAYRRGARAVGEPDPESFSAEALTALGYAVAPSLPTGETAREDPRDHPDADRRFMELTRRARSEAPEVAVRRINEYLIDHPAVAGARLLLSLALERLGDWKGARAALAPLLSARPNDAGLFARDVELQVRSGDVAGARSRLQPWVSGARPSLAIESLIADLDRQSGRCDDALPRVEQLLRRTQNQSRLLWIRTACLEALGDVNGTRAGLDRLRMIDPANPDLHYIDALLSLREHEYEDAIPVFEAALRRRPHERGRRAALAQALAGAGRWQEAMPHLEATQSWVVAADVWLRLGRDPERAIAWLELEAAGGPLTPAWHRVRSAAAMASGDAAGAVREATLAAGHTR